jgi:hypothetical protein
VKPPPAPPAARAAPEPVSADWRLLEWGTRWMDDAIPIPGTRWRIGLDPIIGLVPGIGDATSAVLSVALLGAALRLGAPRIILARMGLNVAVDFLLGIVPVVGDVTDAFYKANRRNLTLLRGHALGTRRPTVGDYLLVGGVVVTIAACVAAGLAVTVWLVATLAGLLA